MSDLDRLAAEPRRHGSPPAERAPPPFEGAAGPRDGSQEINERRARTENPDLLRRLRSL